MLYSTSANATRSLDEFKKLAQGAQANIAPSGNGGSGTTGGTTGTTNGNGGNGANGGAQTGTSAGSMLTVPGALSLLGFAASALLL